MTDQINASTNQEVIDGFLADYLDFYPVVYSSIITRIGNAIEAEDLTQEVFIIYYKKIDAATNKRSFLYGIMRNVVLNYYKKHKPDSYADVDELNDVELAYINGFKDSRLIIKNAIEEIECDEIEGALLDLISMHNYSYNEAAAILGLTKRQVQHRYNQVIERLMRILYAKGITDLEQLL